MTNPKINVIINCYNGEQFLEETLKSVYAQSYTNWEIIFFDNASIDKTPEIVKAYSNKIKYYRNDKLVPLGQARNMALKYADAEFIAFLDADDLWHPDKLKMQIKLFDDENIGFVYTNYNKLYQKNMMSETVFSDMQKQGNVFRSMVIDGYAICLSSVILRTIELKKLETYFDNNFQIVEEFDLFMRLFSFVNVGYVHQPLVDYRIHDKMTTLSKFELNSAEKASVYKKLMEAYLKQDENDMELHNAFINKIQRNKALNSFLKSDFQSARNEFYPIRNYSRGNMLKNVFYHLPTFILKIISPVIINKYLRKL